MQRKFANRKSIDTPKPTTRRVLNYQQDINFPEIICYETLDGIQKDLKHVKYPWLVIPDIEQKLLIGKLSDSLDSTSKIIVDEKLCVIMLVWCSAPSYLFPL